VRQRNVELWSHSSFGVWQNLFGVATRHDIVAGDVRIIVMILSGTKQSTIGFSGNSAANLLTIMALIAIAHIAIIFFLLCRHNSSASWVKSCHIDNGCKGTKKACFHIVFSLIIQIMLERQLRSNTVAFAQELSNGGQNLIGAQPCCMLIYVRNSHDFVYLCSLQKRPQVLFDGVWPANKGILEHLVYSVFFLFAP
jgi:hypothetical protein